MIQLFFLFASKEDLLFSFYAFPLVSTMPADTMEKQTASPIAGAPANGAHTPDKPKNASEHRKVKTFYWAYYFSSHYFVLSSDDV